VTSFLTPLTDTAACRAHFARRFSWGGALAERLERHVEPLTFHYTFAEPSDQILDFRHGGKRPQAPIITTDVGTIQQVLDDDDLLVVLLLRLAVADSVLLLDLPLAEPSDGFLSKIRSRVIRVGNRILVGASGKELADETSIEACLKPARYGAPRLGILARPSRAFVLRPEISPDELEDLCENVELAFVDAYDGESVLIASRRGLPEATSAAADPPQLPTAGRN